MKNGDTQVSPFFMMQKRMTDRLTLQPIKSLADKVDARRPGFTT
jgi:hypothetical protein